MALPLTCRGAVNSAPLQISKEQAIKRIMTLTGCTEYIAECVLYVLRLYRGN